MPIHIILGKPGAGKSLYAVRQLIRELRDGRRNVVTNLPLHLGRLNEYLQKKFPEENLCMVTRVRVLSEEQLREFWKYRGPEDGDKGECGVAYFLDEAHIAFNARDWATLGRSAIHYMSQHRKLGDIVWPITQAPGNLDKQFRSVAEDYTVLRNEYTAKYGIFRGRGRFVRKTYLQEPQQHAEPFETESFELDKEGIASCYDTAQGIGVHGSSADIGRRAKGIPIWVVIPIAMVIALACVLVPLGLGKLVTKATQPTKTVSRLGSGAKGAPVRQDGVPPAEAIAERIGNAFPPVTSSTNPTAPPLQQQVWVSGVLFTNKGKVNVTLSDGRTITEQDGQLRRIARNFVELNDGTRLYRQSHGSEQKPAVAIAKAGGMAPAILSPVSQQSAPRLDQVAGSWVTGDDGVTRLREKQTLVGR